MCPEEQAAPTTIRFGMQYNMAARCNYGLQSLYDVLLLCTSQLPCTAMYAHNKTMLLHHSAALHCSSIQRAFPNPLSAH
eukprot:7046-Heterococcus_DN1.PRE.3